MKEYKPTVVMDFAGVIHSHKSDWQGQKVVPDPAVPGIREVINELWTIHSAGWTEMPEQQVMDFHSRVEMAPPCPTEGLRPCRAAYYDRGTMVEVLGLFHRWGSQYEEFEAGPGNLTTALVEAEDGKMYECIPATVQFLDRGLGDRGGAPDGLAR